MRQGTVQCRCSEADWRSALAKGPGELVDAKMEDDLSLDEMAESVGLSTAHFARMFRKSTGETPHQFVLRQRLERAKAMLRARQARVLDVAVACGFKTQQHFAQFFVVSVGVSPTEYRQDCVGPKAASVSETQLPRRIRPLPTRHFVARSSISTGNVRILLLASIPT